MVHHGLFALVGWPRASAALRPRQWPRETATARLLNHTSETEDGVPGIAPETPGRVQSGRPPGPYRARWPTPPLATLVPETTVVSKDGEKEVADEEDDEGDGGGHR
eukprot:3405503-Pyramimonas_sp.AAC.1